MYDSDVSVQSIVFHPEGAFDITFAEQRDFNPKGTLLRQLMAPAGLLPEQHVQEVLDAIRELLDMALEARNDDPTTRLSRR